jgi:hypothetical protein
MKVSKKIIAIFNACLAPSLMLMSQASYAVDAGHAQFVNGNVQIRSVDGQESILKKGDVVREGDTLTTATAASAQIEMLDGGLIAVRSDTKLKFDTFKFNGTQDGSERSFFSLFTGGFRAVTGLIGKLHKSSFHITTAAAVIGIRGTDHETYVVTAGSPMAAVAPVGTYNKVNWGETTMTTDRGTISILPNQMGYVSAADQMPELKPLNINLFTATSWPLTKAKASKKEDKQVRKTAAENKSGKKEITVEAVTSAGRKNGKEVRETATNGNASKKKAASTLASASRNNKATKLSTYPDIAMIPTHIQGIGVPATVNTIIDRVTAINWGRWNENIAVTGQVTGEFTKFAPKLELPWADGPKGMAVNAGPMGTDAVALPASDINTYSNVQGTGTAMNNNPNAVGANQNASASQLLINDNIIFTLPNMPNNSNGLAHRNSGRGITP